MIVKQLDFTTVSLPSLNTRGWSSSLEKWSRVNWEELHFFSVKPIFSSTLLPLSIWRIFFLLQHLKEKKKILKTKVDSREKWIELRILMILCGGEISIDWDSDDASSWKTISSASASAVDFYLKKWLIRIVDQIKFSSSKTGQGKPVITRSQLSICKVNKTKELKRTVIKGNLTVLS